MFFHVRVNVHLVHVITAQRPSLRLKRGSCVTVKVPKRLRFKIMACVYQQLLNIDQVKSAF